MHTTGSVPPPPGDRRRAAPRRRIAAAAVLGVLAAAVPVLWITGGLQERPEQPVKQPGRPLDVGLFELTVRDARVVAESAALGGGKRFLVVRMRVVNKGKETISLGSGGLADGVLARTPSGKWIEPQRVEGVAAGAQTGATQPELPVEASAMWEMGRADPPEKLTVGLRQWKYDSGFTDDHFRWQVDPTEDEKLAARLTLPVAVPAPGSGS